jgi:AcrR family transcriptional regulator
MEPTGVVASARERVRDAVRGEIIVAARVQLGTEGAGALSLRAVARELGMASSAVYRYFKSRDELLTALIVEAYDALGAEAEAGVTVGESSLERWRNGCRSVRRWALSRPTEYALIYGSPVPGYQAPELTVAPASRVLLALAGVLAEASHAGELADDPTTVLPTSIDAEMRALADFATPGVPPLIVAKALVAWNQLYGQVSFEVFGQLHGLVQDTDAFFDFAIDAMAHVVGFRSS